MPTEATTFPVVSSHTASTSMVRPRLTDHYGIAKAQSSLDFAIPFLDEDIPLYLDPFLIWKSPSQQDQSLHLTLLQGFKFLGHMATNGHSQEAILRLMQISECNEVGLGNSSTRHGKPIGAKKAKEVLSLFERLPHFSDGSLKHMEETQLYIDGISKDRISDFSCNLLKSFLLDFTIEACDDLKIPMRDVVVENVYSLRDNSFSDNIKTKLPFHPVTNAPIIFVPKRWLRHVPWINYQDYFKDYCPQDDLAHEGETIEHVKVLRYNLDNYGVVQDFIAEKERTIGDCHNDPLFTQIPVVSAKRKLKELKTLTTGNIGGVDKQYEAVMERLLPSLLYPHLDFAESQSRTDSGVSIRDLIFYNSQSTEFLENIYNNYKSMQIVFELKNVKKVERQHIDQINRYLSPHLGTFGVIVTRNELCSARQKQVVDLWSGQRKSIITLSDLDIEMMVEVFESRQRSPLDILKKKYVSFKRKCP